MTEKNKCFICDKSANLTKTSYNIFTEKAPNGKPFTELLGEVFEKPIIKEDSYSKHICKICHTLCTEYNSIKLRLQVLKSQLLTNFKSTLLNHGRSYDTYNYSNNVSNNNTLKSPTKIVLPASKLQPLPPDYVINVGKLPLEYHSALINQKTLKSTTPSMLNLKVTVGSSVLTQSIKTTSARLSSTQNSPIKLPQNHTSMTSVLSNNIQNFNIESFKKEEIVSEEDRDAQSMDIDEDCNVLKVGSDDDDNILTEEEEKEENADEGSKLQYFDVSLVGDDTRDDGDADEFQETIVMSGDNASILRVMAGQKIVYQNGEISLVVPDDDNSMQEDDQQDDGQDDSNDESHIEFQVSGDEETAKAIIAAAQEQGGAFIKVESGEMFRVQSVQSTKEDNKVDAGESQSMVEQEGNLFKCLVCDRNPDALSVSSTTGTAEAIMNHMKFAHNARIYICEICKKVIRKRSTYTAHMEEHGTPVKKTIESKSRAHECSTCHKKFNSRTLMEEHKNIHSGARPYQCNVCDKTFSSKYTFQAHVKIHMERPRPYKCKQCPKSFLTPQNLTQHEKTHLGIKDFVCNICDKAFGTQHNLEVHGVVHSGNKPFVCLVCGKGFARRAEVRDHMRTHTGERPFACDTCGATFAQRSNLHSHKRATHMDDKRYHCTACPKKFKRRRLLEYHVKACHTGERPLVCGACHATFVYPEHYKKHMRIHSGERPFSCEVCGKTFNSRDNRNTHRFVHSDKKPYECLVCGLGYMRKQLLYAHMNTSGHLAESIVVNQPRVQKVVEEVPTNSVVEIDDQKQDKSETIFEAGTEFQIQTIDENTIMAAHDDNTPKIVITNDKQIILQNGNGIISKDNASTLLMGVAMDGNVEQSQLVTADGSTGMFRLVQIQLDNGTTGWVVNE